MERCGTDDLYSGTNTLDFSANSSSIEVNLNGNTSTNGNNITIYSNGSSSSIRIMPYVYDTYNSTLNSNGVATSLTPIVNTVPTVIKEVIGGTGADTLADDGVGNGADTLIGNSGNDTFIINNSNDMVSEAGGSNSIIQTSVNYSLINNTDQLILNAARITGTGLSLGNDILTAAGANDTMTGAGSNDTFTIATANTNSFGALTIDDHNGNSANATLDLSNILASSAVTFHALDINGNIANVNDTTTLQNLEISVSSSNYIIIDNYFDGVHAYSSATVGAGDIANVKFSDTTLTPAQIIASHLS